MLKKLNNKTGCAKVNTSFVSTVPWSKFCQSKLTTVYQRYEVTAISIRKGLFKCTLAQWFPNFRDASGFQNQGEQKSSKNQFSKNFAASKFLKIL